MSGRNGKYADQGRPKGNSDPRVNRGRNTERYHRFGGSTKEIVNSIKPGMQHKGK